MFIPNQKVLKRIFDLSISGTRGGPVRLSILKLISRNGMNINQLAGELKLDYKTVQHHMRVLEKSGFVAKKTVSNENVYSISGLLRSNSKVIDQINSMGKDS